MLFRSLQPTAPFLLPATVNACLARLDETGSDSVVTVRRVVHNHPYRAYERGADGMLRPLFPEGERLLQRQDLPPVFALSGGFYVRRADLVRHWSGADFALGSRCVGVPVSEVITFCSVAPSTWSASAASELASAVGRQFTSATSSPAEARTTRSTASSRRRRAGSTSGAGIVYSRVRWAIW